jgi:hypothetical protein
MLLLSDVLVAADEHTAEVVHIRAGSLVIQEIVTGQIWQRKIAEDLEGRWIDSRCGNHVPCECLPRVGSRSRRSARLGIVNRDVLSRRGKGL